ncbi:DUF6049 family protein [Nonomuraea pusilla]|uniref:Glycoprotein n=1 Tax=Nonomuraea pusilla TaxID=46177 RepID=A0A1H8DL03_9ACTN|nr:DUF6049 family protein [Nonomuraea pusilla]SEN08002.1 hypothetical protein SAMN05660976_06783 [Nonomuraea pusilla]
MIRKAIPLTVLSAALLTLTGVGAPSSAAMTTHTAATAKRQNLVVTITSVSPQVPRNPTDVIKFTGTVRNDTGSPMTGLGVRLRYNAQRFTDRAAMAAYESDQNTSSLPFNVSRTSRMDIPSLAAGASARWEFTATPAQLGMNAFGVYPVAVDVSQFEVPLNAQRTYLTYAPAATTLVRNRMAVALPVIDQPHRATDDPLFVDDRLSQAITGKGRLADLVHIAQQAPRSVTWFVDPALLDDVQTMTKGYQVKTKNTVENKASNPAAERWITDLRTALAASPVVATPYADPDVAALAHQGLDTQTSRAIELGGQVAGTVLKRPVATNTNWPPNGVLDDDALDLLSVSKNKVDRVLLDASNLPPRQQIAGHTPDGAATLDSVAGPVTALVADSTITGLFEPDARTPTSVLLSTQRFIAETAMMASEPGQTTPRSIVVAPSRRWDPKPALVTALLKTANKLPWLTLTTLDSIKATRTSDLRAGLTYAEGHRKEELSAKYLKRVKDVASKAQLTASILTSKPQSRFDAAVLRLTSSAWRTSTRTGRGVTKLVSTAVNARVDKIQITGAGPDRPRTLAGSNGVVPISVKNSLEAPISLYIDVKSNNPELLQVNYSQTKPLTIGSGQSGTVQVPMNATTSGDATVTVQLMTADRQPYGKPQRLTVRTTGYTGIALVIVGAALTVMLAAVVTRVLRRRSERRVARTAKTRESETV